MPKPESKPAAQAAAAQAAQKPAGKDAMLDLFQTEVTEENALGKFADTLEDIDVHELLTLSTTLRNQLRGVRQA
jgi:hypothetical protein